MNIYGFLFLVFAAKFIFGQKLLSGEARSDDKTCKDGDGIGGRETFLGKAENMDDCVSKVREQYPKSNGASFKQSCESSNPDSCKNCFAEVGMVDWNGSKEFKACLFIPSKYTMTGTGYPGTGYSERNFGPRRPGPGYPRPGYPGTPSEECTDKSDCPNEGKNFECNFNVCECAEGFVRDNDSCVDSCTDDEIRCSDLPFGCDHPFMKEHCEKHCEICCSNLLGDEWCENSYRDCDGGTSVCKKYCGICE